MPATTFDALGYAKKLEKVGFTREQAETQAAALQTVIDDRLVTRDYLDSRLKEIELRLQKEIQEVKYAMLKWQLGIGLAIIAIMAKGFGWIGF